MNSRLLDLFEGIPSYCIVAFVAAVVAAVKVSQPSKLNKIPTVGSTGWLGSWWAGIKHVINPLHVIQEGYEKYGRAPFKIALFNRWVVILSSREHVEEMCRTPDHTLSFLAGINEELGVEHTLGHGIYNNPYHVNVLLSQLTRNIGALYPQIRNEIIIAFDDILDLSSNEWKSIPAYRSMETIICRVSNRMFVGLPLCRDPDWLDLNIHYTARVAQGTVIVRLFPTFLKPLAARLFTKVIQSNERARELVGPIIEERLSYLNEYGNDWTDKPRDVLSWLMEEAEGPERTVGALSTRILVVNLVSLHTTTINFTHALLYLAANPQYIQLLRKEVEAIIGKEGWSKVSVGKMQKIDSFLKECGRMEGFSGVSLTRKALEDFTFSDGTFIPKGTIITTPTRSIHFDEALYPNAHAFEPFRFADMRQEEGEEVKHHLVSTTPQYLAFGHGRHGCPGRFSAANELKTMLAHVVVTYDIKLADEMVSPRTRHTGMGMMTPDPDAKVMFRNRAD